MRFPIVPERMSRRSPHGHSKKAAPFRTRTFPGGRRWSGTRGVPAGADARGAAPGRFGARTTATGAAFRVRGSRPHATVTVAPQERQRRGWPKARASSVIRAPQAQATEYWGRAEAGPGMAVLYPATSAARSRRKADQSSSSIPATRARNPSGNSTRSNRAACSTSCARMRRSASRTAALRVSLR